MDRTYGPYPAKVIDLHDADTVHLDIDLGFGMLASAYTVTGHPRLSCRIFGINAAELSTDAGKQAAVFARTLLTPGLLVTVLSHGFDKYGGRWDGSITLPDGRDFGQVMLSTGHAVPYPA